jgi:hypothetical protein
MIKLTKYIAPFALAVVMSSPAFAVDFSDDFESYNAPDNLPIGGGWLWFLSGWNDWPDCNVDYWFGFGPNPALNSNDPYIASNIVTGVTGQALNVFSDYSNQDVQASDKCAEVSVFQEVVIADADTGQYDFRFDVQADTVLGDGVRTYGFIKILDPAIGYATVYTDTEDTTTGGAKLMSVTLGASEVGKILQFGFANISNENKATSRYYDNVTFALAEIGPPIRPLTEGVPIPSWAMLLMLGMLGYLGASRLRARKES